MNPEAVEILQLALQLFLVPIAGLLWKLNDKMSDLKIHVAENYVSKKDLKDLVLSHVGLKNV